MADLLHNNYHLLQMLGRMEIELGFGDQTIAEICRHKGLSLSFFRTIFLLFTDKDYEPEEKEIVRCPPEQVLAYLRNSHTSYLNDLLPELNQLLNETMKMWEPKHATIVTGFFTEYRHEIEEHLAYEETEVFPYVQSLLRGERIPGFSIAEFEKKHDDIEAKVMDLKNILIKYIPASNDMVMRDKVLLHLFILEEDLNRHLFIENRILVPTALRLEKE